MAETHTEPPETPFLEAVQKNPLDFNSWVSLLSTVEQQVTKIEIILSFFFIIKKNNIYFVQ